MASLLKLMILPVMLMAWIGKAVVYTVMSVVEGVRG